MLYAVQLFPLPDASSPRLAVVKGLSTSRTAPEFDPTLFSELKSSVISLEVNASILVFVTAVSVEVGTVMLLSLF